MVWYKIFNLNYLDDFMKFGALLPGSRLRKKMPKKLEGLQTGSFKSV